MREALTRALAGTPPEPAPPPVPQTPEPPALPSDMPPDAAEPSAVAPLDSAEAPSKDSLLRLVRTRLAAIFHRSKRDVTESGPEESESETAGTQAPSPFSNAVDFNPLPPEQPAVPESSDQIFADIGRQLRARREMLSLTYEEIERHTRVRANFLEALERGEMEGLPSPVQTRGILASFAAFIDLDPDTILLRFADGVQARHREQRPDWPPRTRSPMSVHSDLPPLRSFIASDLIFGGGAAIMLILFAAWGINRVLSVRSASPARATAPSISDILAGAPMPTIPSEVTLIPAQATLEAPPTAATLELPPTSIDPSITVQLKLTASERTYMRILVDDKPAFEGRAEPGKDYYYQAARQIELLVGDAAALRVTHNGRDLGLLGGHGEVVDRLFTARSVLTPTPTTPPTRTPTLTPTTTLRPTPTLATYTPTPRPQQSQ